MDVTKNVFNARKQQRVCFACGEDHLLYTCPQYTQDIIDRVGKKRFSQGVTTGLGKERGQLREQRMREEVKGVTKSGRNNQWREKFCQNNKAHARKMDEGSLKLGVRKVNLEHAKMRNISLSTTGVVDEVCSMESSAEEGSDVEMGLNDDSMKLIMQYKQAGPGNGRRGQCRG